MIELPPSKVVGLMDLVADGVLVDSVKNVVGAGDVATLNGTDMIGFDVGRGLPSGTDIVVGAIVGATTGAFDFLSEVETGDTVNDVEMTVGAFCLPSVLFDEGTCVCCTSRCRKDFSSRTSCWSVKESPFGTVPDDLTS